MARRATSLGPKPSLFVICFFGSFPFFAFNRQKNPFSPLKRAFFVYFLCFSFFLPLPFLASPFFNFSFSVSLLFFSFYLPSSLSLFCFFFVSCFCLLLSFSFFFAFVSGKEQHQNIQLQFSFFLKYFSFFWFPVLLSVSNPFFLSLLFPDKKKCFLFNINVFSFKKQN